MKTKLTDRILVHFFVKRYILYVYRKHPNIQIFADHINVAIWWFDTRESNQRGIRNRWFTIKATLNYETREYDSFSI